MLLVSTAGIISTAVQGVLHGFAVFMFVLTMFMLTRDHRRRRKHRVMIGASCTLLLFATAEFVTNIVRLVRGLITIGPHLRGGVEHFFLDVTEPTFVVKAGVHTIQILILDGIVIYRAYVVWAQYWALLVPGIGWCGVFASSFGLMYTLVMASQHPGTVFAKRTASWIHAMYATTLATNMTATGIFAFRLWSVNRKATEVSASDRLHAVFRVVVESGVIYTVANILSIILFAVGSPGVFVIRDMVNFAIISIAFNMVVVRVGFAATQKFSALGVEGTHRKTSINITAAAASARGPNSTYQDRQDSAPEMKPFAVELSRFLESSGDVTAKGDPNTKVTGDVAP